MTSRRQLFRTQALKHYAQNRQKDILPAFVAPPAFLFLWILLLLAVIGTLFAWQEHVPTYVQTAGILLEQQNTPATALLFVPSNSSTNVAVGQKITIQVNVTGQRFNARVALIDQGQITPEVARIRYALIGDARFVITQPSIVVHLSFSPPQAAQVVDHSSISAQIQVGLRSLLSLLPGLFRSALGG